MEKKKIVIVGGVAGGASAAARLRRLSEDAEIIICERGEYISFANCGLPYYIGEVITERDRLLVQTPEKMKARYNIDVRVKSEVVHIDRDAKKVTIKRTDNGEETVENYDALILSPGAEPVRPPISGSDLQGVYTLRTLNDTDAIKRVIDTEQPARAVVVGAGYIGLEMAEALRDRGIPVTVVELLDQVMAPVDREMAAPLQSELVLHGVDLRLGTSVTEIAKSGRELEVQLSTGESLVCGMVLLSVGVKPEVRLAKEAGITIGERGGIVVDAQMRTNDPSIFAVGDAIETTAFSFGFQTVIPLAGPANRQGRIAADAVFGRNSAYRDTQGTGICKVFNLAVGMVGLNEKLLKKQGIPYHKVYVHPASHAGYYPGAHPLSLKLLFSPEKGKILGAQAVGADGIDKRIDVLSTAMRAGLTVFDLEHLELSYAPPFGSAKDPVNYAGFVAANMLRGDCKVAYVEDIVELPDNQVLLDVRTPAEIEAGKIPDAIEIPLDELRGRLDELPKDTEIIAYCKVGLRGYLACRILEQNGFTCRNLTGGFTTYRTMTEMLPHGESPTKELKTDTGLDTPGDAGAESDVAVEINACGMQCPGPIMQLKQTLEDIDEGQRVRIRSTDPGFAADIPAWCRSTGNVLENLRSEDGAYCALITKATSGGQTASCIGPASRRKTMVVFSGDFDKAMAAFIIANGAAAMGSKVTLFFTFWGLNILRDPKGANVKKTLLERMFGWMMPRGAGKLSLSKMNMGGMGTKMIKHIMKQKNVSSLEELIQKAQTAGVQLVACSMSMDLMGIKKEELIDGVEEGGVAMFLGHAEEGNVSLFI